MSSGIEVTSVKSGPPVCIPLTDVGVSYDEANCVLTLPGYLDRSKIEQRLRSLCKGRTMYAYRCHTWRNAISEPQQRDI